MTKKTNRKDLKRLYVKDADNRRFNSLCSEFDLNQEEMFEKILTEWEDEQ